jgi:hypothetical protein
MSQSPSRDRKSSTLSLRSGGRKNSSKQLLSRCGEAPLAKNRAARVPFAWKLPQLEILGISLPSRLRSMHQLPTLSPLATTVVHGKKKEGTQQSRNIDDQLPCRLRAPRAATPSHLTSMASQRSQLSPSSLTRVEPAAQVQLPLASTAGHRGKRIKTSPHPQEDTNTSFIRW